jgi:hypothetical protein
MAGNLKKHLDVVVATTIVATIYFRDGTIFLQTS